jgi:S-adenosyl methyltransferase
MTARSSEGRWPEDAAGGGRDDLPVFDITVANPARIWDYWLGGKDHFAADREAAQRVQEVLPTMPEAVLRCRRFLALAVRRLAADYGVRQFLDIGTGLPTAGNTHELAQEALPGARVVYVDFDPVVATHARALLTTDPEGRTRFVLADLRDTKTILDEAAETLDFSQPVGIVLTNVLHFIPDADEPHQIVSQLMDRVAAGSFLVMVHGASDVRAPTVGEGTRRYNQLSSIPVTFRSRAEVTRFFDGLEILDVGRGSGQISEAGDGQPSYYAIGRKP